MKSYTNELGHMTNMAIIPIYIKIIKKSYSPDAKADDLENWYVALSMQVLPRLFKL